MGCVLVSPIPCGDTTSDWSGFRSFQNEVRPKVAAESNGSNGAAVGSWARGWSVCVRIDMGIYPLVTVFNTFQYRSWQSVQRFILRYSNNVITPSNSWSIHVIKMMILHILGMVNMALLPHGDFKCNQCNQCNPRSYRDPTGIFWWMFFCGDKKSRSGMISWEISG